MTSPLALGPDRYDAGRTSAAVPDRSWMGVPLGSYPAAELVEIVLALDAATVRAGGRPYELQRRELACLEAHQLAAIARKLDRELDRARPVMMRSR